MRLEALLASAAALADGTGLPPWLQEVAQSWGYTVSESGIPVIAILGPLVTPAGKTEVPSDLA